MAADVSKDPVAFILKGLPSVTASTSKRLDSRLLDLSSVSRSGKQISLSSSLPHDLSRDLQALPVGRRLSEVMPVNEVVIPKQSDISSPGNLAASYVDRSAYR
jgi:hypothetical protein